MTGNPIAIARQRAGLTQFELAKRAGTSQPAIARLEAGAVSPTLATLQRIAEAAGMELQLTIRPLRAPDPVIDAYKPGIDRSLHTTTLARTPSERLQALMAMQAAELQRAAQRHAARIGPPWSGSDHP